MGSGNRHQWHLRKGSVHGLIIAYVEAAVQCRYGLVAEFFEYGILDEVEVKMDHIEFAHQPFDLLQSHQMHGKVIFDA
jgi:hypothetical protein